MEHDEIRQRHKALLLPGYGTVFDDELIFIQDQIVAHKPRTFVEVGMASGLSTGFIAQFLEENGGQEFLSIDYDDTFFGDTSKPNGFLVPEIYQGTKVDVTLQKFAISLDVESMSRTFDMGFVDANHQHPWPVIDTLALYPFLTGPKLLLHHDLRLFASLSRLLGLGPKYLFDQFPESHRVQSAAREGNIFLLDLTLDKAVFEARMADAFLLPWSLLTPLQPPVIARIQELLETHYSANLLAVFNQALAFYNRPDYRRAGQFDTETALAETPAPPATLTQRIARRVKSIKTQLTG